MAGWERGRARLLGRRTRRRLLGFPGPFDCVPRGPPSLRGGVGWKLGLVVGPASAIVLPIVFLCLVFGVPSIVLFCGGWELVHGGVERRVVVSAQARTGALVRKGSVCRTGTVVVEGKSQAGCGLGSRIQDLQLLAELGPLDTRVDIRLPEAAQRGILRARRRLEALRQERADVSLGTKMKMRAGSSDNAKPQFGKICLKVCNKNQAEAVVPSVHGWRLNF